MGKINYYQWLNGGCGCNGVRHISGTNDCDCDQILLEISNLHTDDEVLQDEIDDLSGVVATISGGCDCDLSDYYTKEQVDELIPTVPSLSGYATEQWVNDKGYITTVQPLKTINGESIVGEGNIVISGGSGTSITVDDHLDSASTNPVQNKVIVEALNAKLDASAYTPTDLSNYYNKTEVDAIISGLTSQIAFLTARINNCCGEYPVSPTDLRYTGTTTADTEVSLSCCTESSCEELVAHDIVETTEVTGNLKTINVGECITIIGIDAFTGETNLTTVILPSTITYIRNEMLANCTSIKNLTLLGTTPPTLNGGRLFGLEEQIPSEFKIYVPASAVNTYKSASGWSTYASIIEAI